MRRLHGPIRRPRQHIDKYASETYGGRVPFKDEKKKIANAKAWRESRTPEYHKWLYDRRAFRFWKAEKFEEVLTLIANGANVIPPSEVATLWLYEANKRELEVGLFFDHEKNCPTNIQGRSRSK